jgi:hypothetical protein
MEFNRNKIDAAELNNTLSEEETVSSTLRKPICNSTKLSLGLEFD